jgi:hypothetical protein
MKFTPNLVLCFIAVVFFCACRNNSPQADLDATTETGLAGDTVKISAGANRFEGIGVSEPKIVEDFVNHLKTVLEKDDKAALAAICTFPFRVNTQNGAAKSKHSEIKDAAQLMAEYDKIFTPELKTAIIAHPNSDLFCNYQGLMLGKSGQAWAQYDTETKTLKVFVVNK